MTELRITATAELLRPTIATQLSKVRAHVKGAARAPHNYLKGEVRQEINILMGLFLAYGRLCGDDSFEGFTVATAALEFIPQDELTALRNW